jgi:hypothetical protein
VLPKTITANFISTEIRPRDSIFMFIEGSLQKEGKTSYQPL